MRNAQLNHSTACFTPKNTIFILNIYSLPTLTLHTVSTVSSISQSLVLLIQITALHHCRRLQASLCSHEESQPPRLPQRAPEAALSAW